MTDEQETYANYPTCPKCGWKWLDYHEGLRDDYANTQTECGGCEAELDITLYISHTFQTKLVKEEE